MEPLVVYIIGDNRSGSTLLDYLLSNHPNAVSVGELHHLHGYYCKIGIGKGSDWRCSCGDYVENCEFWQPILNDVSFSSSFETWLGDQEPKWHFLSHSLHRFSLHKLIGNKETCKKGESIAKNRWKLYNSIAKNTGNKIIIDSSKFALEGLFLHKFREGKIQFVLLERDIWEVAYSKMRHNQSLYKNQKSSKGEDIYKEIMGSYRMLWRNRLLSSEIQKGWKETLVKKVDYLSLASDPEKTLKDICAFLNIEDFVPPDVTQASHGKLHILGGSSSRYEKKAIKPDVRWKDYYKGKPVALRLAKLLGKI